MFIGICVRNMCMEYVCGLCIGYVYIYMDYARNMHTYMEYVCMYVCVYVYGLCVECTYRNVYMEHV